MLVETSVEAKQLGRRTQDFLAWTLSTGDAIAHMRNKPPEIRRGITRYWQETNYAIPGVPKILHPKDSVHYPAILFARNNIKTYIQSTWPVNPERQRRALITQVSKDGYAAYVSPARDSKQNIINSMIIKFGRAERFPNSLHTRGFSYIHISPDGVVTHETPIQWEPHTFLEFINLTLTNLFTGQNVFKDPRAKTMADWVQDDPPHVE